MISFASEGGCSISSDIFSMIVFLVQVNLDGAPVLILLDIWLLLKVLSMIFGGVLSRNWLRPDDVKCGG